MAQPNIISFWKKYTGIIGNDINGKYGFGSKLLKLFQNRKKQWLEESGHVLKHVQYYRPGLTADPDASYKDQDNASWPEAIKNNAAANYGGTSTGDAPYENANNVDPPTDTVKFSYDERGYGLIQKAFNTEDFSAEDLRASAMAGGQMNQVVKALTMLSKEYWVRMHRDELSRVGGNRYIATGTATSPGWVTNSDRYECYDQNTANRWNSLGFDSTSYDVAGSIDTPDKQDLSVLTWGHLDDLYLRLMEDGGEHYTDLMSEGAPVFILVTDPKSALRLRTEGTTNGRDVRTDLRESDMVNHLLAPMGVKTAIKGWVILSEFAPRRFDITGDSADSTGVTGTGVWTERLIYTNANSNTRRDISATYRTAVAVESYAFAPNAFTCFAPRPNYTGVGAATFKPQNYAGDYAFRVIEDKTDNPDGAHGFFRGKLANATVAEDPDLIYTIRHREGEGTAN